MQNIASRLTSRSAERSFDCSARHPDFRILWKVSILHRSAYQRSFVLPCVHGASSATVRAEGWTVRRFPNHQFLPEFVFSILAFAAAASSKSANLRLTRVVTPASGFDKSVT